MNAIRFILLLLFLVALMVTLAMLHSNLVVSMDVMSDECVLGRSVHRLSIIQRREVGSKSCLCQVPGTINFKPLHKHHLMWGKLLCLEPSKHDWKCSVRGS